MLDRLDAAGLGADIAPGPDDPETTAPGSAPTPPRITLRSEAGANPYDKALSDLIGELSTRSDGFRTRWAAHNVRFHRTGHKKLHHPVIGDLELNFEAMELPSHPGLTMLVYTAPQGSPAVDGLKLLASWAATAERTGELAPHVTGRGWPFRRSLHTKGRLGTATSPPDPFQQPS